MSGSSCPSRKGKARAGNHIHGSNLKIRRHSLNFTMIQEGIRRSQIKFGGKSIKNASSLTNV